MIAWLLRLTVLLVLGYKASRPEALWHSWPQPVYLLAVFIGVKLAGDLLRGRLLPGEQRFAEDLMGELAAMLAVAAATWPAIWLCGRLWGVSIDAAWPAVAAYVVLFGLRGGREKQAW